MKYIKVLLIIMAVITVVSLAACKKGGDEKTPEPTATAIPTDTPVPTPTPEPTPTPTPDPDADVNAVLYRFAFEGEDIVDTMFNGKITSMNCSMEFTEDGLVITVENLTDPYFYVPFPDGYLDLAEHPYFKILFKNEAKANKGQLYIGFDGEQIASDAQHYAFDLEETDDWQEVILDLRELKEGAQTITSFRADLIGGPPLESTITVDYFGFFATLEEAENYQPPNRRAQQGE